MSYFKGFFGVLLIVLVGACSLNTSSQGAASEEIRTSSSPLLQGHIDVCNQDPRVTLGLVPLNVCVGADLFFRESFSGNGRTCGSCHPSAHNFTIDPGFIATLPPTDPLFVAEQDSALSDLEIPTLMHQFGLIRENVDGFGNVNKFAMRSVPHCFSLSTSVVPPAVLNDGTTLPPNQRTGWSGDGAPNQGELRDFQTGAVIQHYTQSLNRVEGTDFVLPTSDELDDIVSFVGTIGRSNELDLTTVSLTDANADVGRATFINPINRCNGCHHNAGANIAAGGNKNFNTGVENLRISDLDVMGIPHDGGFGGQGLASFNFDTNHDGINDSFGNGTFSTPPLIEAADTGPFFHTNAFSTIENAISFYTTPTFAQSPAGGGNPIPLLSADIANLGRFLRVLNTAFNCQLSITRVNALIPIITSLKNHSRDIQQGLASLALAEVNDALNDLSGVSGLNADAQTSLTVAQSALQDAATNASHVHRLSSAQSALTALTSANTGLGTGLTFTMGQGTLMF